MRELELIPEMGLGEVHNLRVAFGYKEVAGRRFIQAKLSGPDPDNSWRCSHRIEIDPYTSNEEMLDLAGTMMLSNFVKWIERTLKDQE